MLIPILIVKASVTGIETRIELSNRCFPMNNNMTDELIGPRLAILQLDSYRQFHGLAFDLYRRNGYTFSENPNKLAFRALSPTTKHEYPIVLTGVIIIITILSIPTYLRFLRSQEVTKPQAFFLIVSSLSFSIKVIIFSFWSTMSF